MSHPVTGAKLCTPAEDVMNYYLDDFVKDRSDVYVVDDHLTFEEIAKAYIKDSDHPGTLCFYDCSGIVDMYKMWFKTFDHIQPFYAIKCNPMKEMCDLMTSLPGICFDCASPAEIEIVLNAGYDPSRIIYANPVKSDKCIEYMMDKKVYLTTIDSPEEVQKMYDLLGERARLIKCVLRIYVDDTHALVPLGSKFGCHPDEYDNVFKKLKEHDMNIVGVSFHVGTGNYDPEAYRKAVLDSLTVFELAKKYDYDLCFLDFGGGWPGTLGGEKLCNDVLTSVSEVIATTLDERGITHDQDTADNTKKRVQMICEPGRYFNSDCIHLSLSVENVSKRGDSFVYYMNEGTLGVFKDNLLSELYFKTVPLIDRPTDEKFQSIILGPSGLVFDVISGDIQLPKLCVGDRLLFTNMGAYTLSLSNLQCRRNHKAVMVVRRRSLKSTI